MCYNCIVIAYYSLQILIFPEKQIIIKQMQRKKFMLAEYYDHCSIRFTIAFMSNILTTTIFCHAYIEFRLNIKLSLLIFIYSLSKSLIIFSIQRPTAMSKRKRGMRRTSNTTIDKYVWMTRCILNWNWKEIEYRI